MKNKFFVRVVEVGVSTGVVALIIATDDLSGFMFLGWRRAKNRQVCTRNRGNAENEIYENSRADTTSESPKLSSGVEDE